MKLKWFLIILTKIIFQEFICNRGSSILYYSIVLLRCKDNEHKMIFYFWLLLNGHDFRSSDHLSMNSHSCFCMYSVYKCRILASSSNRILVREALLRWASIICCVYILLYFVPDHLYQIIGNYQTLKTDVCFCLKIWLDLV